MRPSVPNQVELNIATTAVQLVLALAFTVNHVLAFFHDGQIRFQEMVTHTLHHAKAFLETQL